jgi:hypothetical protein
MNPLIPIDQFTAVCDRIHDHLRTPDHKRPQGPSLHMCHAVFCDDFPEVSLLQFAYAAERWIQSITPTEFTRFPGWNELMAFLYRCDGNGLPVRHAGFKPDLPAYVQPAPQQLAMLPPRPDCNAPEGAECPEMYRVFSAPRPNGLLPEGYR